MQSVFSLILMLANAYKEWIINFECKKKKLIHV